MIALPIKAAAAALPLMLLLLPASATAQASADSRPITAFTHQNVQAVLTEIGATTKIESGEDDRSYIRADMKSGLVALFEVTACGEDGGCDGLNIMAIWDRPKGWSDSRLLTTLSDFENKYAFIKAGVLSDGSIYLQRYIISDYGNSTGNIRVEAMTFETIGMAFGKIVGP